MARRSDAQRSCPDLVMALGLQSQVMTSMAWRARARVGAWVILVALAAGCAPHLPSIVPTSVAVDDPTFAATLEGVTGFHVVGGNHADILRNGDEIFPAVLAAIGAARSTITYAQYFYEDGRIGKQVVQALAERCRAGVAVHLLLDGFGGAGLPDADTVALRGAGCQVAFFRAAGSLITGRVNHRNHRRILVVDGRVGFTGGSGLADRWLGDGTAAGHWRDTDVRLEGPVVRQLQSAFVDTWQRTTGVVLAGPAYFPATLPARGAMRMQVVTSAPAQGDYALYTTLLLAIRGARRSIRITNPYFVPDDVMREALAEAVRRGVRVEVLLPGALDSSVVRAASRAGLGPLLQAGIIVYEYLPALLHAKTMVVDDAWVTIGSANLDPRSFALNGELNVVIYDRTIAAHMTAIFANDVAHARRIRYVRWTLRPFGRRVLELLAAPFRNEL
jgi:cardiolipin synthase